MVIPASSQSQTGRARLSSLATVCTFAIVFFAGLPLTSQALTQISKVVLPANVSASSVPVVSGGAASTVSKAARKLNLGYNAAGDIALLFDAQGNETRLATDSLGRTTGSTNLLRVY